ncbi:MAG: hypothetical protein K2K17_07385 [Lachnospiraceae bacterium]|nr:hypothetical protein [Lachnospiraceae bacterium]
MRVYNIEFFTQHFEYRDSIQAEQFDFSFDYMDIAKSKFKMPAFVKMQKGDYFRAQASDVEFSGIVTDIKERKDEKTVSFKPFLKYLDVDIMIAFDTSQSVEAFLKELLDAEYVNNTDTYENIAGLTVGTKSTTAAVYGYDFCDGIHNLYDIFLYAFEVYGVVADFKMNPATRSIICSIGKVGEELFTIEADLDNVFDRKIIIKEAKDTVNKIYIYNEEDYAQTVTYYKGQDDTVSTLPETRITPVIVKSVIIKVGVNETFKEKALAKAMSDLKATKYENLIEIECEEDDLLVRPHTRKIGQAANIIKNETSYSTVLTGYQYKSGRVTLIFGTIRLELTKLLKKKWRKG